VDTPSRTALIPTTLKQNLLILGLIQINKT
jgi:hypothetical protein